MELHLVAAEARPGNSMLRWATCATVMAMLTLSLAAAEPTAPRLMSQAEAAYRTGDGEQAIALADRAVAAEPDEPRWVNHRGMIHFRLGHIERSIADFDAAIVLAPALEPYHWQRGISYYYAGEYEKGARQFEIHRTVNPQDVENAAWHFLCVARAEGVEAAQKKLIPIQDDPRVPMMEIHRLFAGKATPEQVLEAAAAEKVAPAALHQRLFYAHLYLGLYFEAMGDAEASAHHIRTAAEEYPAPHYMHDVARVHHQRQSASPDDGN